jgi:hypothetical protein
MGRTVNHDLEVALGKLQGATDSRGLRVMLCSKPLDLETVRLRMMEIAGWFTQRYGAYSIFITPDGEECAARNLALLAKLYEANLIERRVNPDACKPLTS